MSDDVAPETELANLESKNSERVVALATGKLGMGVSMPQGTFESLRQITYLEHLLRHFGLEVAAKLDFAEKMAQVLDQMESSVTRAKLQQGVSPDLSMLAKGKTNPSHLKAVPRATP